MRYLCLALVAFGALMFPFAAKRLTIGLSTSDPASHDIRHAILFLIFGILFCTAGHILSLRDEASSQWRNRSRSRRIRLR
ncbi:MAG TPA: hypothetical protein VFE58_11660 [Tepidisphaeraceae bacterium]|jgi:hypothetical protein|nr:hypothetical protein [Tepidisphaeraceae bacterium]